MAAKRFFSESGSDSDPPSEKRMRTRPSFASVIGEVVMVNSLKNFCSGLEPMLRRVVNEEVERSLVRCSRTLQRVPSLRIQAPEPSSLELRFSKSLTLPIFTGSKIVDADGFQLQIILVDTSGDQAVSPTLPSPIKVEIVVLDGDFPPGDRTNWTSEEFDRNIVRERQGKRPLLAGELSVTMRSNGVAAIGDIELTDNSSWIRSRKFKLGARVSPGSYHGIRISEAMTEAFVVKDHRGELYKKHYPPQLGDEVWRLEKIGKEGAFHKKLGEEGIQTVQDFLKLSVVDPSKLRKILGAGMSEKIWDATIKHARTCDKGNKHYIYQGPNFSITLNPICQVERAIVDGHIYNHKDLSNNIIRPYIETLVRQAYSHWSTLEEIELPYYPETPQLTLGEVEDQYPTHYQLTDKAFEDYPPTNHVQIGAGADWQINPAFVNTTFEHAIRYSIPEASSSSNINNLAPPRSFMDGR
ncbi:protein SAR DEFICIENT 1 isoform X1 [Eucalyptus grandis]|uniref:protein SAR DEFICIENT 1 isoform X1 n=1 Tax=Eucalyptus grandis TaxID=71139 RepID=UPI00192E9B09|nr:protein SAR DEFICIENT 1 isoform X1 [Eucalyptus grandis]